MKSLEQRVAELEQEIVLLRNLLENLQRSLDTKQPISPWPINPFPTLPENPVKPWNPGVDKPWMPSPYKGTSQCPKCGLQLQPVMGYVCNQLDCPVFSNASYCNN